MIKLCPNLEATIARERNILPVLVDGRLPPSDDSSPHELPLTRFLFRLRLGPIVEKLGQSKS